MNGPGVNHTPSGNVKRGGKCQSIMLNSKTLSLFIAKSEGGKFSGFLSQLNQFAALFILALRFPKLHLTSAS